MIIVQGMRRVVFVNRYFFPDHSATSQMAGDLAFFLAERGWAVEVITSRQRYGDAAAELAALEVVNKVTIRRVATTRFGRASLRGRAVDYATFYLSALLALRRVGRGAVVVALTDPPLVSVIAALASKRVVNWVQDLFPEVAESLGVLRRGGGLLRRVRDWSLRRARANVALSEAMAQRLPKAVVKHVRHNWADAALHPVARESNRLRREWELDEHFVAGYSGNFGRAHEFETVMGAIRLLQEEDDLRFLFIGTGARVAPLQQGTAGNVRVQFRPYQPREVLSDSLSAADVHLVSLDPSLEGLVVPSKFYGILAVGRPVLYIGDAGGDLARLITTYDLGFVVAPGDAAGLAVAITALARDRPRAAAMGARGKTLYDERFAPAIALPEWERILMEAAS
jgi:colanic acid biosynthesis glycosyl transferase WcaI